MLLWSGQAVSATGSGVTNIAFPLFVLALTHGNAAVAGFTGAMGTIPYVIFSLPAGALIDRWNRKLVMMLCDVGRALALGSIPLALALHVLTIAQMYVVALVNGTLFVFFDIAEVACLARVVSPDQLTAANGQNQATFGLSSLVSQPLGGLLYSINAMLPFSGDAVSYLASVFSLGMIKTRFQGERKPGKQHLWQDIREGVAWLWRHKLIRFMAFLTGSLNFIFSGSFLIIILLAQHKGATPFVIGVIGAIIAVGGIAGAALAPTIQRGFTFGQVIVVTMWIQAVFWPLQILAPNAYVLGAIVAVIFLVVPIYNVVLLSYRLSLIPDELQGRVNSAVRLIAFGFMPLGFAFAGIMLNRFGTTTTIVAFGVVFAVSALLTTLNPLMRAA